MSEILAGAGGLGGLWALKTVLGPTLTIIGDDLPKLYAIGRDKIIQKAMQKGATETDGKTANLRVAKEVLWNGSFTQSEICAEYFGGILASSRTQDGDDDSSLPFLELIKGLSSRQLHLHYVIYHGLNRQFLSKEGLAFPYSAREFEQNQIVFNLAELFALGLIPDQDANVLRQTGLVSKFIIKMRDDEKKFLKRPHALFSPTVHGAMLFAVAYGELRRYLKIGLEQFPDLENVQTPSYSADSLAKALEEMPIFRPPLGLE